MNITLNNPEVAAIDWETEVIPASDYCRFLATNTIVNDREFVPAGGEKIPRARAKQGFAHKALEKHDHHWYRPNDPELVAINMSFPYDMRDDVKTWVDPLPGLMRYIKDKFTKPDGSSELSPAELENVRIRYVITPDTIEVLKEEQPIDAERMRLEAQLHMPKAIAERLYEKVQQEYQDLEAAFPTTDPVLTQAPSANRAMRLSPKPVTR